jgi:hypothetical protein
LEVVSSPAARDSKIGLQELFAMQNNPRHPSLRFRPIKSKQWSVRVGDHYRAVGHFVENDTFLWTWIGTHGDYNKL